jgi:hypothetical protein
MSKTITTVIIFLAAIALPWIGFKLWEVLPYDFRINSRTVRNIVNVFIGVIIGVIFIKQNIKLRVLPFLLLLFVGANVLWSIQRFESNKQDLIHNAVDYPQGIPECEKESNYDDLWDYMTNGCHFSTEEFISTIIDRFLVLTIAILLSRILFNVLLTCKTKKKDIGLIDQDE